MKTKPRRQAPDLDQRARPTPERLRHANGDVEVGTGAERVVTMRDSPLERARARGVITALQYDAGVKFRHHWYHAGMAGTFPSPADMSRVFGGGEAGAGMPRSEGEAFHRQQYRMAVEAAGKTGSMVLTMVCGQEEPLDRIGHFLGWGSRAEAIVAATERLRAALDDLIRVWRM